jgi:hypothetical protein
LPVSLLAETAGSGDDIQLSYRSGSVAEAQMKRGLRAAAYVPLSYAPGEAPRGRPAERRDGDREGRPCPALSQPDAVRARLASAGREVAETLLAVSERLQREEFKWPLASHSAPGRGPGLSEFRLVRI